MFCLAKIKETVCSENNFDAFQRNLTSLIKNVYTSAFYAIKLDIIHTI